MHLQEVKKLEYGGPKELNKKEASEITNVLGVVSIGVPKMGLDSNCYNKWIKKVHNKLREDVKEFKDCI